MRLGIIDIGTNSTHMILVEIRKDLGIEILDRAKEFTRLGDMTFQEGTLSPQAMERGIAAIRRFMKLAKIRRVQRIKAVATSAVREAVNGGDFIDLVLRETGIKVQVITGEEEARLIYTAVKNTIPLGDDPSVVVDIGGGSVEMIVANSKGLIDCASFKLGVIRLKDEFIKSDPPSKKEINRLSAHVASEMKPFLKRISKLKIKTLIGTSGTIINLGVMAHWQHTDGPLRAPNQCRFPVDHYREVHRKLLSTPEKERQKIKGLDASRSDTIIPGSLVLQSIFQSLKIKDILLCDAAIREGMVYDYMERNRSKIELESQIPDLRLRSVTQLAKKCDYKPRHAHHVRDLALSLFDQTRPMHKLGERERDCLNFASLLHDVGYHISYRKHHKHTYYLIKNADLNGLDESEVDLIANIARYHTKGTPKNSHDNWKELSRDDRRAAMVCASILRLVDAMDRSHFEVVHSLQCRLKGNQMVLQVIPAGDTELEVWAANKRKDLFEEVFGRKVVISISRSKKWKKKPIADPVRLPKKKDESIIRKIAKRQESYRQNLAAKSAGDGGTSSVIPFRRPASKAANGRVKMRPVLKRRK